MKNNVKLLLVCFQTLFLLNLTGCHSSLNFKKEEASQPLVVEKRIKKNGLALVLGAGGAKGIAHVGVIEELEKAGVVPDVIIGCSAGAIVGALYAANPDIEALKAIVLPGKTDEIIETTVSAWPYSIYSDRKLVKYLEKNLKIKEFKDLKIPFIAAATHLEQGSLVAFGEGSMIKPLLASAAYPGAFPPVKINEDHYFDCGVSNPVPVKLARRLGIRKVVAVNIAGELPDSSPSHIFGVLKRSIEISYLNHARHSTEGADVIIDLKIKNIPVFTDKFNDYLYESGKLAAQKAIPSILKLKQKNGLKKSRKTAQRD